MMRFPYFDRITQLVYYKSEADDIQHSLAEFPFPDIAENLVFYRTGREDESDFKYGIINETTGAIVEKIPNSMKDLVEKEITKIDFQATMTTVIAIDDFLDDRERLFSMHFELTKIQYFDLNVSSAYSECTLSILNRLSLEDKTEFERFTAVKAVAATIALFLNSSRRTMIEENPDIYDLNETPEELEYIDYEIDFQEQRAQNKKVQRDFFDLVYKFSYKKRWCIEYLTFLSTISEIEESREKMLLLSHENDVTVSLCEELTRVFRRNARTIIENVVEANHQDVSEKRVKKLLLNAAKEITNNL